MPFYHPDPVRSAGCMPALCGTARFHAGPLALAGGEEGDAWAFGYDGGFRVRCQSIESSLLPGDLIMITGA